MRTEENRGQGLTYVMDEDGRSWAIPAGGSGEPAPAPNEGGSTVSGDGQEVQSTETPAQEPPAQEGAGVAEPSQGGQGFIEPYLKDVPEDQRPVVQPILERMRQEQDRNFNQRFEQLQHETDIPVKIHQALIEDPEQTLDWIADRLQEERGINVRDALLKRWNQGQETNPQSGQGQQVQPGQEGEESDRPLTQADVDRILEQREQERQQQQLRQQQEQQQYKQQAETVTSWVNDAAKQFKLPLDDTNGEDPLRPVIIMQANDLHSRGVAKGKAAVEMAVETVAKRFGSLNKGNNEGAQPPKVADGGTPPPGENFDVNDPKQRKARMTELFTPPSS